MIPRFYIISSIGIYKKVNLKHGSYLNKECELHEKPCTSLYLNGRLVLIMFILVNLRYEYSEII